MISLQNQTDLISTSNDSDYFRALFNHTVKNSFVLMDDEGIVIAINHAFTNYFGYESADIVGKNAALLFTEEDQKKGLPQQELRTVLSRGHGSDNNYLVSKDKTLTWVSGESVLVKNGKGKYIII